jgi:hypothetical protein
VDGAVYVWQCNAADYDPVAMTCAAPFYGPAPQLIPSLSIADAQAIGLQCALLWATAWGLRKLAHAVNRIG